MESSNPTHGDRQASSHSPSSDVNSLNCFPQEPLHARDSLHDRDPLHEVPPTIPRKRVVFDYDPSSMKISTRFTMRNDSNLLVTFKVHSTFDLGLVVIPHLGVIPPGEACEVTVIVDDLKSIGRDLQMDELTVDLASVESEDTSEDNINYEETRTLSIAMTEDAKDRLAHAGQVQIEINTLGRHQRVIYVGTGAFVLLGVTCVGAWLMSPDSIFRAISHLIRYI